MFHQIIIAGRLGKDQEGRYTPDGKFISNFSVAVDDGYGDRKKTIWVRCSMFGERAEKVAQYLNKGQVVLVTGRLNATETGECRVWTDNSGKVHASFEMVVSDLKLMPGGPRGEQQEEAPAADVVPF